MSNSLFTCVCVCARAYLTLPTVRGKLFSGAKICDLNVHVFAEQNVLRLQISAETRTHTHYTSTS